MEAKNGRFYETALWGIPPDTTAETKPIDVVIGSGRKGQTYLYWKGDRLFQLPVSYWVELGKWVNSPGYQDGYADFARPVPPRCLDCHSSYAELLPGPPPDNRYQQKTLVLGISCERCHGPGSTHVSRHQSGSVAISEEAIVTPAKLSRDRQVEVCAQCPRACDTRLLLPFRMFRENRLTNISTRIARIQILKLMFMEARSCC